MKRYLYTPGPVMIPESTLLEMAQPIIHHRTPQFSAIFAETLKKLKWLFQTEGDVLVMASTGTGGMEASVTNFLSPGDKAIYVNAGKFGERWDKIFKAYGIEGIELTAEWGQAIDIAVVQKALDDHPDAKGVYIQASETSTGVAHPIEAIAKLTAQREKHHPRGGRHHRAWRVRCSDGQMGHRRDDFRLAKSLDAASGIERRRRFRESLETQ